MKVKLNSHEKYYRRTRNNGPYRLLGVAISGAWDYYPACKTFAEAKRKAKYHVLHDKAIEYVQISKEMNIPHDPSCKYLKVLMNCIQCWVERDGKIMVGEKSGKVKWVKV